MPASRYHLIICDCYQFSQDHQACHAFVQATILKKLTRWTQLEETLTPPKPDSDDEEAAGEKVLWQSAPSCSMHAPKLMLPASNRCLQPHAMLLTHVFSARFMLYSQSRQP